MEILANLLKFWPDLRHYKQPTVEKRVEVYIRFWSYEWLKHIVHLNLPFISVEYIMCKMINLLGDFFGIIPGKPYDKIDLISHLAL